MLARHRQTEPKTMSTEFGGKLCLRRNHLQQIKANDIFGSLFLVQSTHDVVLKLWMIFVLRIKFSQIQCVV